MLNVSSGRYHACDGVSRRSVLKAGVLGMAGLTLANLFRLQARAGSTPGGKKAVIQVFLSGGLTHIDSYDPKPSAPAEFRGEFKSIPTRLPGVEFSEMLPAQAAIADKLAVIRSMQHTTADHDQGQHWMMTGFQPNGPLARQNDRPSVGSIVAKLKGSNGAGLPPYVGIPNAPQYGSASYLGPGFNPFSLGGDPSREFKVRNVELTRGLTMNRLDDRKYLLSRLDRINRERDSSGMMEGLDRFTGQAYEMITGPAARQAFDIAKEDPRVRERYGRNRIGQSCLLARRLVEAGVSFVTISEGNWDHHGQVFASCRQQLPPVDQAVAALVEDLYARGLDQDVLLLVWGEFGRTPRVNGNAGRDHWPGAMSAVVAGGGLRMGQAVGSTNSKGERPVEAPCGPEDLLQTVYHVLGIDPRHEFHNESGRPMPVLNQGKIIDSLIA